MPPGEIKHTQYASTGHHHDKNRYREKVIPEISVNLSSHCQGGLAYYRNRTVTQKSLPTNIVRAFLIKPLAKRVKW